MSDTAHSAAARKRAPTHPGELLREDVLPAAKITVTKAAGLLGVSRQTLHAIISEKSPVTPEMAVRLGALFRNGPDLWLRMQTSYDLWHASKNLKAVAKEIEAAAEAEGVAAAA